MNVEQWIPTKYMNIIQKEPRIFLLTIIANKIYLRIVAQNISQRVKFNNWATVTFCDPVVIKENLTSIFIFYLYLCGVWYGLN